MHRSISASMTELCLALIIKLKNELLLFDFSLTNKSTHPDLYYGHT